MAHILEVEAKEPIEAIPNNGKSFTLAEMQHIVGGSIQIVSLPKKKMELVINEEGELDGLPINELATKIWLEEFPLDQFSLNNNGRIVGNALLTERKYIR